MSKTNDFPDLDAAIDAEAWQWLQETAPVYADAVTAEVRRGHEPFKPLNGRRVAFVDLAALIGGRGGTHWLDRISIHGRFTPNASAHCRKSPNCRRTA